MISIEDKFIQYSIFGAVGLISFLFLFFFSIKNNKIRFSFFDAIN